MSTDRSSQDVVDAAPGAIIQHRAAHRYRSQSSACLPPQSTLYTRNNNNGLSLGHTLRGAQNGPIHRLVRTSSGRSYMETTFDGAPNHNQENIPPLRPTSEVVLPLRPTNGVHYEATHPPLRPTSSVNNRDIPPLRSTSCLDLPPLRATKSSSELPPLRPTSLKTSDSSSSSHNTSLCSMQEESLISLAEAARPRKHSMLQQSQQIAQQREWYETSLDSPAPNRKSKKSSSSMIVMNDSMTSDGSTIPANQSNNSTLNVSGSSVGSTGSSNGSVFPSNAEANSSHSSLPFVESPRNHMVISTGSYQPSQETSKPFEMSDFYKYSTKYRRQSSGNGNCSSGTSGYQSSVSSSSGDMPLSPVLPPRGGAAGVTRLMPPSPTLVAQQSTPAPQHKGVYQPLSPMSCQPLAVGSPAHGKPQEPVGGAWEGSQLHQAVPATVTHKRSATLV